ncbi:MAG: hypothetical protein LBM95_02980 [Lactobacillales bacterium]|jgi:hypothetical protein|nr:hypothetical protein [Lactobacillales bacterium]
MKNQTKQTLKYALVLFIMIMVASTLLHFAAAVLWTLLKFLIPLALIYWILNKIFGINLFQKI